MTSNYPPGVTGAEPQIAGDPASEDRPDFVDVHITLDWIIRVHGTTDGDKGLEIAEGYVADQELHRLVTALAHEDGVLCDGDPEHYDEDGNLAEEELTIALYPESQTLPTNVPVAVATYNDGWLDEPDPVVRDSVTDQVELRS